MNNHKIKVMQILGDAVGGIRNHVHEVIKSCPQHGFEIYYAHGSVMDSVAKSDIEQFDQKLIKSFEFYIAKNPHYSDILNVFKIASICKINKVELIHGHGAKGGVYSRLVGVLLGLPSIYTPHGGSVHANFGRLEGFIYRAVERILKSVTRLYLFESNYTYKSFVAIAGELADDKFIINHNGISINLYSAVDSWLPGREAVINLLVVGMLREIKGQAVAVRALAKLKEISGRRFHLHFCGAGPNENDLISIVKFYGLNDDVTFYGEVSDISKFYAMSNIVIIPSLYESFGYVAIEASLMRRPVVASDCGGLSEIILNGKTGYLFPVGDEDLLAKKVVSILENYTVSNEVVIAAELRVKEKFNLCAMLDTIFSAYRRLALEVQSAKIN